MKKGFSLIEVMVSMVVFSVGMVVLIQALMSTLNVARRFEKYRQAAFLLNTSLLELDINGAALGRSNRTYDTLPYAGFYLEINTQISSDALLAKNNIGLSELAVSWKEKGRDIRVQTNVLAKVKK